MTSVQPSWPPRQTRNLEERLIARFPALYRRPAGLVLRLLSPRSRLRRALVRRQFVSGWAAFSRRDFETVLVRFAPDAEFEYDAGQQSMGWEWTQSGLGGTFRGHQGMLDALGELTEVWDSWEFEPAYILDLGDRMLGLGFFRAQARASGVRLEHEFAQLITLREGLVARDGPTGPMSWEDGLRAAGLDPRAFVLPRHAEARQAVTSVE